MFRNCRQRHCMRSCQIGYASISPGEMGEDPSPGRVGQGGKGSIQHFWRIVNHLVNYIAERFGGRKHFFFQLAPVCRSSLIAVAAATIGQAEMTRRTAKSSASTTNSR